jgi:hypothetical protein
VVKALIFLGTPRRTIPFNVLLGDFIRFTICIL